MLARDMISLLFLTLEVCKTLFSFDTKDETRKCNEAMAVLGLTLM